MTPAAAAARRAVQSRNATEEAILDAARDALAEKGFDGLTMDAIARKAFVSRTAVYFYFPNKRAVVDRLIQQRVQRDVRRGDARTSTATATRARELRAALARVVAVVNDNAARAAARRAALGRARRAPAARSGRRYILRFVERAEARIARDQERGIAPDDIPPRLSAQALLAMVERHITRELVLRRGDANESIRVLAELWWRAVYSRPGPRLRPEFFRAALCGAARRKQHHRGEAGPGAAARPPRAESPELSRISLGFRG